MKEECNPRRTFSKCIFFSPELEFPEIESGGGREEDVTEPRKQFKSKTFKKNVML